MGNWTSRAAPQVAEVKRTPSERPPAYKPKRERREVPQINMNFIPKTIADPGPEDPCGLYIEGVNFHWDHDRFKKDLEKKGIVCASVTKKKSKYNGIIRFDNNEDRRNAYDILIHSDQTTRYMFVAPLKRDLQVCGRICRRLKERSMSSDLETRTINDRVAPWHSMPYDEQLTRKSEKFSNLISPIVPPGSAPIHVFPAVKNSNYRNKVELTFGFDRDEQVAVGFNLGSKAEDIVLPVTDCVIVDPAVVALAEKLRRFVVTSGVPVFDRVENAGVWKFVLIRTTEAGQSMMVICTYGALEAKITKKLKTMFGKQVTSLYYAETTSLESWGRNPVIHHLNGPKEIIESLRGLAFEIGPMSFFQTNTSCAELLFEKIEELAEVDSDTILVDCCCGTGVIGLAMAHKVKEVIGIDIEEGAIVDAIRNAEKNKIGNARFIAGKAEDVLQGVLEDYSARGEKIVCIVDPPRSGLHKDALRAIRSCDPIKRLVYVACNPDSLVQNCQKGLCRPMMNALPPFEPAVWFSVDMFPHTDRVELVMLMKR